MTAEAIEITATLDLMFNGRGALVSHSNYYECVGPDGARFTNSNKATLLSVLRRHYKPARIELNVIDRRQPVHS